MRWCPAPVTRRQACPLTFHPSAVLAPVALDPARVLLPLALERVPAGFPSPALDYLDERIDLTREIIRHPAATFLMRVQGDSMVDAGIHSGDLLVIDRSVLAAPGAVVIAALDGCLTVKRLCRLPDGRIALCAANPDYPPIVPEGDMELVVWGVVTYVIHRPYA